MSCHFPEDWSLCILWELCCFGLLCSE